MRSTSSNWRRKPLRGAAAPAPATPAWVLAATPSPPAMGLVPFVALRFGFLLERAENVLFAGLDGRGDRQAILLFFGRRGRLHVLVEHHVAVAQRFRGDSAVADLAQGNDRVFIAVPVHHGLRA